MMTGPSLPCHRSGMLYLYVDYIITLRMWTTSVIPLLCNYTTPAYLYVDCQCICPVRTSTQYHDASILWHLCCRSRAAVSDEGTSGNFKTAIGPRRGHSRRAFLHRRDTVTAS
jgi:hypothetical protein